MRWKGRRQSQNVEDRRGRSGPKMALGGGLGTIVVLILVSGQIYLSHWFVQLGYVFVSIQLFTLVVGCQSHKE